MTIHQFQSCICGLGKLYRFFFPPPLQAVQDGKVVQCLAAGSSPSPCWVNIIKPIMQHSLSLLSPMWTPIEKDLSTMNISGPRDQIWDIQIKNIDIWLLFHHTEYPSIFQDWDQMPIRPGKPEKFAKISNCQASICFLVLVSSQQWFGATDIKALGMLQLSGLEQTMS